MTSNNPGSATNSTVNASTAQAVNASATAASTTLLSSPGTGLNGAATWTAATTAHRAVVAATGVGRRRGSSGQSHSRAPSRIQTSSTRAPTATIASQPGYKTSATSCVAMPRKTRIISETPAESE